MIKLDELLREKITPELLKEIIESENTEQKFILGLQIIFTTEFGEIGWSLLHSLDLSTIIDQNIILDLFIHSNLISTKRSHLQIVKFINFVITTHSNKSPNMAIQKHLAAYSHEKSQDNENLDIDRILQVIEMFEDKLHNIPPSRQYEIITLIIKELSKISPPREPNDLKLFQMHILKISQFLAKLTLDDEDKFRCLEYMYSNLTNAETTSLMSLGFLVIPESTITNAVEYFFKSLQWKGRKTEESVIDSIGKLIYWLRTTNMPVPLDLWIIKTISVLFTNGLNDLVDEIAKKNVTQLILTLLLPIFQSKTLPVLQSLIEHSRNSKEIMDMIAPRVMNVFKQLESSKSEIYGPFIKLICEILGKVEYTKEEKYKDIIQYLSARNRSPSKIMAKNWIGPTNLKFLSNNPRVGLENLGNTCYLNSVLQAMFMTKQFCREILTTQRSDRTVIALQKLFALMLFSPRPEQNPAFVVNLIRPDDFLPGIQHDSSEFLGSILDRLHELENKMIKDEENWDNDSDCNNATIVENKSYVREVPMDLDLELDGCVDDVLLKTEEPKDKIVDNTANLCQTYIQKIFGGKISTRYLCSTCNGNSINIDTFRELQLSFPENSENENCDVQYNVQKLLEFYFTTEELTSVGDNQYHCDNCKILCNGIRCTEILEPPRNLILTLKHFRYDSRHHIRSKLLYKVFHDEVISVNVKGSFNSNSTRNVDYKLYAAVIHSGTSLDSGHYYTIARESENKWFKFNDSYVTNSSLEELRSLISPNTPYILFYQRLSTASSTIVHPESASSSASSMLSNQINDQNFPEFNELPTFLKDIIDEDKTKFETESMAQENSKISYRVPVRDNYDDNNDPGNDSYSIDESLAHNRFIY